ncbi:MAG: hypothetical protein E3J72_00445 [Planctomycetota bacterium]|nr:MAG: hypothetical protein E3J72_00445 [Planctomycetota bacterium]
MSQTPHYLALQGSPLLVEKSGISCYIDDGNAFPYTDVLEDDFEKFRSRERLEGKPGPKRKKPKKKKS